MTLSDLFDLMAKNPSILLFYFGAIIATALLAGVFSKGEGDESPWTYLYSGLIYLACVPGIFAVTLNIYTFIFERKSVYDMNIYAHFLPIIAMVATLMIIRRNVDFDDIPGFSNITALITIISVIMILLWILEKTHIFVISFMPFQYALIIIGALLVALRLSFKRLF